MFPGDQRVKELRERFGVTNGRFFGEYRFKNLNWYFTDSGKVNQEQPGEWFCYGDIRDDDVISLRSNLNEGELLILGWKELRGDDRWDEVFRDGGGVWMAIAKDGVVYDRRRDGAVKEVRP
jgi:hypothetical protein